MMEKELIEKIKTLGLHAYQPWVDKRGWKIIFHGNKTIQVWIYNEKAHMSLHGYGGSTATIAKTPTELEECFNIWTRNR